MKKETTWTKVNAGFRFKDADLGQCMVIRRKGNSCRIVNGEGHMTTLMKDRVMRNVNGRKI